MKNKHFWIRYVQILHIDILNISYKCIKQSKNDEEMEEKKWRVDHCFLVCEWTPSHLGKISWILLNNMDMALGCMAEIVSDHDVCVLCGSH